MPSDFDPCTCAECRRRPWRELAKSRAIAALLVIPFIFATGCATTYRPALSAPGAFTFTLTPEQCATLRTERRAYHATQETALYVSSAGALVTTAFLAVPSLREERVVQGLGAGTGLLAGGVGAFTNAQVSSLDEELALGGCQR